MDMEDRRRVFILIGRTQGHRLTLQLPILRELLAPRGQVKEASTPLEASTLPVEEAGVQRKV